MQLFLLAIYFSYTHAVFIKFSTKPIYDTLRWSRCDLLLDINLGKSRLEATHMQNNKWSQVLQYVVHIQKHPKKYFIICKAHEKT